MQVEKRNLSNWILNFNHGAYSADDYATQKAAGWDFWTIPTQLLNQHTKTIAAFLKKINQENILKYYFVRFEQRCIQKKDVLLVKFMSINPSDKGYFTDVPMCTVKLGADGGLVTIITKDESARVCQNDEDAINILTTLLA